MLAPRLICVLAALVLSACSGEVSQRADTAAGRDAAGGVQTMRPASHDHHGEGAAALYARAQAYMRCAAFAETPQAVGTVEGDAREAEASASVTSAQRARAAQERACRQLGAGNVAQVDQLLREAASNGSLDAKLELLRRRASAVLERQPAAAAEGQPLSLSVADRAEIEQVTAALETMAMQGNRAAMPALDQLLSSPLLDTAEPLYADAWRLVSQQPFGRPLQTTSPLQGEEMFEDMDPATERQVVLLARDLHATCCAR